MKKGLTMVEELNLLKETVHKFAQKHNLSRIAIITNVSERISTQPITHYSPDSYLHTKKEIYFETTADISL